ncbi:MAG: bifunctional (p)ppGpp synthetase/guanosine-3',5'-bis(diphosphate) 3'-pyrophosphohydrolase [Bacteroidetes bacterium]|nr:bifunctional (p)ppGpp synthetase/guanosine-3',5'-bis(diphosphate) 3'-pyrophosphohydrolase [Bacteroidota bacterium]
MSVSLLNEIAEQNLNRLLETCHRNLKTVDDGLIRKAFQFSYTAHQNIKRASGEPYFIHPLAVATILAEELILDDISVAAALLHDIIEDTDYEFDFLKKEFGITVANLVDGATKITDMFKSHEVTEAESFRKLMLFMIKDIRVILVKFADRLHNMRTLQFLPHPKQIKIATETLDIYAPLAHRFGLWQIKWELEDLSFKYLNPESYEDIFRKVNARREEREGYINQFTDPIAERLTAAGFHFELSGRPKHFYSIYNKMVNRGKPFEEIYDLFAVRIILDTQQAYDCFTVYGIVSDIYFPVPVRFKDYISVPKHNGYQSIHTTVVGPAGKLVEVQIRTRKMHEIAEKGVAAHWSYKEAGESVVNKQSDEWISWVREIFDQADSSDNPNQFIEDFKLNLFQDEIFIFTPKGDLKILPKGSTPVDFAYEIHTNVGNHCIGAKINGKIVPLNTRIDNGNQVEIITSKNQKPNPDWEKFVVTHKAKSKIRAFLNEEKRKITELGREMWEKRVRKSKLKFTDLELNKLIQDLKYPNQSAFFHAVGFGLFNHEEFLEKYVIRQTAKKEPKADEKPEFGTFEEFVKTSRSGQKTLVVEGKNANIQMNYAKCCNPVPGDEIVGYVTIGEGIKVHRKNCRNIVNYSNSEVLRLVDVDWPKGAHEDFMAGIRLSGEDRKGLVSDITNVISKTMNTNIRGLNFNTKDGIFDGSIIVFVNDVEHLLRIIDRIKRIEGVKSVARLEE